MVAASRYSGRDVALFRLGMGPNGALGALAGMAEDYNDRHKGHERIDYEFFDEYVREAITPEVLRSWRDAAAADGQPFVLMICGVQTAMYPRARDIALMARREGIEVLAGGVHLSAHAPSVQFFLSCGVHVAIGEVEPIWDRIIEDCIEGNLQPSYRITTEQGVRVKTVTSYIAAPDVSRVPFPHIPKAARQRYVHPSQLFVDSSRGCPFLCTFCVVKNVFGRTVRGRDPERLVAWIVDRVRNDKAASFWFTDDNFVRNAGHRELLERLAAARAAGNKFSLSLTLDVESTCYARDDSPRGEQTREFLRLCQAAGVAHVFMGLESTNDAALQEMRKGVNRDRTDVHATGSGVDGAAAARARLVERYKTAVSAWHEIGASVECGYLIGFEADGPGVGLQAARDIVAIGVDIATFYLVSPLPGSEDYATAFEKGTLLEPDFNEYFRDTAMIAHPTMSASDMEAELRAAIRATWTWRNVVRRLARRVLGLSGKRVVTPWRYIKRQVGTKLIISTGMLTYAQGGLLRRHDAGRNLRLAISDEEARLVYLGEASPSPSARQTVEPSMLSLPVYLDTPVSAPAGRDTDVPKPAAVPREVWTTGTVA